MILITPGQDIPTEDDPKAAQCWAESLPLVTHIKLKGTSLRENGVVMHAQLLRKLTNKQCQGLKSLKIQLN